MLQGGLQLANDCGQSSDVNLRKIKCSHCSYCGHPGSKRAHVKSPCEYCDASQGDGCVKKPEGFKCNCSSCDTVPHDHVPLIFLCNLVCLDHNFYSLCYQNPLFRKIFRFICFFYISNICFGFSQYCLISYFSILDWQDREEKEKKKQENWRLRVCNKIAMEPKFPSSELIKMYLCDNHSHFSGMSGYVCILSDKYC